MLDGLPRRSGSLARVAGWSGRPGPRPRALLSALPALSPHSDQARHALSRHNNVRTVRRSCPSRATISHRPIVSPLRTPCLYVPFALSRSAARKRSICVACCAAGFSSPVRCATGRRRSSHSLVLSQEVVRCRLLRGYASRLLRRRLEDLVVLREVLVKLEDGRHVAATVAIVGRGPDGDQRV